MAEERKEEIINKSGLDFLRDINFVEKSEGRFFQKRKEDLGEGLKQFYVILLPRVESPVHDHKNENMMETHLLLYGSGRFVVYGGNERILKLKKGKFHPVFTTPNFSPRHKYIAGQKGSICLVLEKHYD